MAVVVLFVWENNIVITAILFTLFLFGILFYSKAERLYFVFVGFFGVVLEIFGGNLGIWTYTNPNLMSVPFWIFFCWGFTFLPLHSVYLWIKHRYEI